MNAATIFAEVQALPSLTAGSHVLFITEKSQSRNIRTLGNQDAEERRLRDAKIAQASKDIWERTCYTHGGLND